MMGILYALTFTIACDLEDLDASSIVRKNIRKPRKSCTSFRNLYWLAHLPNGPEEKGEK